MECAFIDYYDKDLSPNHLFIDKENEEVYVFHYKTIFTRPSPHIKISADIYDLKNLKLIKKVDIPMGNFAPYVISNVVIYGLGSNMMFLAFNVSNYKVIWNIDFSSLFPVSIEVFWRKFIIISL